MLVQSCIEDGANVVDAFEVGEEGNEVRELRVVPEEVRVSESLRRKTNRPRRRAGGTHQRREERSQGGERGEKTYGSLNHDEMGTALLMWKT